MRSPHPSYSPNLVPNGISRVWPDEKHLRGRRFQSDVTVKTKAQKWLREQNVSFNRQDLENLIVRYDKCLNNFADYLER
jgi:hypothetical protein